MDYSMAISRTNADGFPPQIKGRSPLENTLHDLVRLLARQSARETLNGQASPSPAKTPSPLANEATDA
jgi:hypothetical protein